MVRNIRKLIKQLADPTGFFEEARSEGWKPPFVFFLWVTLVISIVTPIVNYLGVESTDLSSSYQAQILAYNILKSNLLNSYGVYAYLIEVILIFGFAVFILLLLTLLLHLVYRLIGGRGPVLNAWKAACYGVGPCLLGGFLPYVSLFVGFYSFAMQFYLGPMVLYRVKEGKAIIVFVFFITIAFIEMFVAGTTVNF
ncbi:MAG: YIP1 family protein [Thermoproteota archaeon]